MEVVFSGINLPSAAWWNHHRPDRALPSMPIPVPLCFNTLVMASLVYVIPVCSEYIWCSMTKDRLFLSAAINSQVTGKKHRLFLQFFMQQHLLFYWFPDVLMFFEASRISYLILNLIWFCWKYIVNVYVTNIRIIAGVRWEIRKAHLLSFSLFPIFWRKIPFIF